MTEFAVVMMYDPATKRAYHTPFEGEDAGSRAHLFMEVEEARGDFPGSLWAVAQNEEGAKARGKKMMKELFGIEYE